MGWIGNTCDTQTCNQCYSYFVLAKYQLNSVRFLTIYRLNYSNGSTGRTRTEGSSMSVSGMGCWNTATGTGQQLGEANFETLNAY